jgi:hypothetical protein
LPFEDVNEVGATGTDLPFGSVTSASWRWLLQREPRPVIAVVLVRVQVESKKIAWMDRGSVA